MATKTVLETLEAELTDLRRQQQRLNEHMDSVRQQISEIKKSASEWVVGSTVRWRGKDWQVDGISFDGTQPVLRQFLKSGKVGVIPKRAWWWNEVDKPVVISAAIAREREAQHVL